MDEAIHVTMAIRYVGDPAGVKAGGVLTENVHNVNVEAKPKDLVEAIDVDVSALEIGDSLRLGEVPVPHGVKILDDLEEILCSVLPPAVVVEEEVQSPRRKARNRRSSARRPARSPKRPKGHA